jgi:hypothetical protein
VVPEQDGDYYLNRLCRGWRQYRRRWRKSGRDKEERGHQPYAAPAAEDPERDNLAQRDYYYQNKEEINKRARKAYANKKTV